MIRNCTPEEFVRRMLIENAQYSIEQKLKFFTNSFIETFIQPLNDCIEDWKKSANTLDKDHAKGLKGILIKRKTFFIFFSIQLIF